MNSPATELFFKHSKGPRPAPRPFVRRGVSGCKPTHKKMITRTTLPNYIKARGEKLTPYFGHLSTRSVINLCKARSHKYRLVAVMSPKMKGRTDLHGQPYKPSIWIYTNLNEQTKK